MHKTGQYTVDGEIDGVKVSSTMFSPLEVYRLAPQIIRLFVPVLQLQDAFKRLAPVLLKATGGKDAVTTDDAMKALALIDVGELVPVIDGLMRGLALPENARLPQELLCRTVLMERDDEGVMKQKQLTSEADINDAFRGRPFLMLKAMWFAGVHNFGAFFPGGRPSALISNSASK